MVLRRTGTRRPRFDLIDRLLWVFLSRWWSGWRDSLIIVQRQTISGWRHRGWSLLWGFRRGRHWRGGRPRIAKEIRDLIWRMSRENFLWGAPRIHGELLKLGGDVSQATVSRYMPGPRSRSQTWRTFLRNQALGLRLTERFAARQYSDRSEVLFSPSLRRAVELSGWHVGASAMEAARQVIGRLSAQVQTRPGPDWDERCVIHGPNLAETTCGHPRPVSHRRHRSASANIRAFPFDSRRSHRLARYPPHNPPAWWLGERRSVEACHRKLRSVHSRRGPLPTLNMWSAARPRWREYRPASRCASKRAFQRLI